MEERRRRRRRRIHIPPLRTGYNLGKMKLNEPRRQKPGGGPKLLSHLLRHAQRIVGYILLPHTSRGTIKWKKEKKWKYVHNYFTISLVVDTNVNIWRYFPRIWISAKEAQLQPFQSDKFTLYLHHFLVNPFGTNICLSICCFVKGIHAASLRGPRDPKSNN